ncbi:MAG: uroporphyrinogen decarboxylase [Hyphomicrobiales bacterium]|nr:uroporphyrinogen decarboxylase [Hyphomicrobiales bacterium]
MDRMAAVEANQGKRLLQALDGHATTPPPVWMMRQAGRYLPEYRALRATTSSFMEFCFNPAKAAEATLQPIRRFGFDAAIIFSDILVIPQALGQPVTFEAGEGPRLAPIETPEGLKALSDTLEAGVLDPVYEALDRVKGALDGQTALIGFCGAPWTVASYMIAGRGTPDQAPARIFAYKHPDAFAQLIDVLVRASIDHLDRQIGAGAEVVQVFDSWASVLPAPEFEAWSFQPIARIAAGLAARRPGAKLIAFPRGVSARQSARIAALPGVHGVGLDTAADLESCRQAIPSCVAVQGNLDPLLLLAGGPALEAQIDRILETFAGRPHIFNLGHGVLPPTPIAHVERLVARVRRNG